MKLNSRNLGYFHLNLIALEVNAVIQVDQGTTKPPNSNAQSREKY
jgi:hypothetical protein